MFSQIEAAINILPVFLVLFTALFAPQIAAGVALGFLVTLIGYEVFQRSNWDGAGVMVERKLRRRR